MTLRSLEIFECVARHCKMSAASKELYIAQPTISQAISQLESELGIKLFDRLSKKLYLTDAGKKLVIYANTMRETVTEMTLCMKDMSSHKIIRFGATMTVGCCVAVDLVGKFESVCSDSKVNVIVDNTAVIEEMLLSSKLDIALVEGDIKSPDLTVIPAMTDMLVLVCSPSNQLANRAEVELSELTSLPFILREKGSGTRETFISLLRQHNIGIDVKWSCYGFDSILAALLANQGVTVISRRIVLPLLNSKKLSEVGIANTKITRNFSLVYHKTKYIDQQTNQFIEMILAK